MFDSNRQLFEAEAVANQNKRLERVFLEAIQASGSEIRGQVAELSADLGKASREERSGLIDRWQLSNREEVLEISGIMSRLARKNQYRRIQESVLHSLYFPQLGDRHARIVKLIQLLLTGSSSGTSVKKCHGRTLSTGYPTLTAISLATG